MTLIPETTDMTGRAGFGIALTDFAGLQNEWILGKDTYTFPRHAEHAGHGGTRLRCHRRRGSAPKSAHRSPAPSQAPGSWSPGTFVPGPKAGTLLAETVIVARGAASSLGGKPTLFP